ncbi:MAG: putative bifunctional diguanylate cyclase/phosphodiesterase [Thermomonas sp.]
MQAITATLSRSLLLVGMYLGLAAFASQFIAMPGTVALFWPASGVALAAVTRYGLRWVWIVPVAMAIAHVTISPVPAAFVPYSLLSNTLGVLAGGWFVRRVQVPGHLDIRFAFRILRGGMLMALISALIGVGGMVASGLLGESSELDALVKWSMGDLLGIVSVAPALLMISFRKPIDTTEQTSDYGTENEKLAWNMALAASFLLLAWGGSQGGPFVLGLASLPLSIMVWSALRLEPIRTAIAVLLSELLIGMLVGLGLAGFQQPVLALDSAILLGYLCLLAILPIILALTVHERRLAALSLATHANTDSLTGLPNRAAFETRVNRILGDPGEPPMALAYLDLDNFSLINDTSSHAAGDRMIVGVAGALASSLRQDDLLAYLGADEFAVLLRNRNPTMAREAAVALSRAVEHYRCQWQGNAMATSASIGVVPFRTGEAKFADLLSKADAACFTAKELGGNRVFLAGGRASDVLDRTASMRWALRIREALEQHRFVLHAQTIAPLHANPEPGRHFELLIRLKEPGQETLLMPGQFMPAAERFGLGLRIDREVVMLALDWLEAHPEQAAQVATCSINLSGEAMVDESFIGFVAERLRNSSFPGSRICFEVTETSAVRDLARAQRFIDEMRALGCRFALDDFGTGFCSFSYLRALDVDYFKIDGSFVREMDSSPLAAEVVRSITKISHLLMKQTIAEHTETAAQRDALAALGVDFAQGYAIDRPMPLDDYFSQRQDGT